MEAWKHLRAVLLLPLMVTVVVPGALLYGFGADSLGLWQSAPWSRFALPAVGVVLALLGLTLVIATVRLFAVVGKGTLAPWDPTRKLVVRGVYRHVRNPMISGVFCLLLGEAIGAGSLPLLAWAALFLAVNAVYIPLHEEPGLVKRFGAEYEEYRRNVPRWIPRLKGW